ncbi:PilZ domain-containing protein [Desulfocurvus sp.]|uniref:PilZ domain-containing protein n=1 Tax=Desulfocurvus sp. TaxID=2871698 RepID=UPI0025C3C3C6|nr:PilZ domain-containing protein [Desulfocurvus sp.]MCK9241319.1 PilZ domain-containing protein [Desulfocurvus sp.]
MMERERDQERERRRQPRVAVCLPAVAFDRPGSQIPATVTNLSTLGCRMRAPWLGGPPSGGFADFDTAFYALGMPWPIVLQCNAVWTRERHQALDIGVVFDGGDQDSHSALRRYIESRLQAGRALL